MGVADCECVWYRGCQWTPVVYPRHAVVVAMDVMSGHQRFFIGHTDKASYVGMGVGEGVSVCVV